MAMTICTIELLAVMKSATRHEMRRVARGLNRSLMTEVTNRVPKMKARICKS